MASAPSQREEVARPLPARPPPPDMTSSERTTFSHFKTLYSIAHQHAEKGLALDENNNDSDAKLQYQKALQHIDSALAMDFERLHFTSEEKESGSQMVNKLTKTRLQVEYRLRTIESTEASAFPDLEARTREDAPPSYEESMMNLGDSIMNDERQHAGLIEHVDADRIFEISDGVQIFFIAPHGYVSAPSYPSAMSVYKFQSGSAGGERNPPTFMQVNDWIYPLIPGTSPALKTTYGAYMFPDTSSDVPGAAVGLMLPDTMDAMERQRFEELLRSVTVMEDQMPMSPEGATAPGMSQELAGRTAYPHEPCPEYPQVVYPQVPTAPEAERPREGEAEYLTSDTTSGKISKGILVAADWITWGLGKGAEKAGHLIRIGSGKLQERLKPEEQARRIDPKVQKGARYAREATNAAVKVSVFVVGKLGEATSALGRKVAPHIRKQGEKVFPQMFKASKDGRSKMDGVVEVAASSLKGFGTVFMGLEASAKVLGKNLANETVHIVNHKYGNEAGKFTENTIYSVGNVAMTAYNADNLALKTIAKRVVKDAGKAVVNDMQDSRANKSDGEHDHVAVVNGVKPNQTDQTQNKM